MLARSARWPLFAVLVAAVTLSLPAPAQAHMLQHPKKQTPRQLLRYAERTLAHAKRERWIAGHAVRFFIRHQRLTINSTNPVMREEARAVYKLAYLRLRDHRWLSRYALRLRAKALARLLPAHYAGWSCITNGAYPGAAHEGNGYDGAYSGPLGMTTPWMGYYPPGGDWVHSNRAAVYAIAERVSARYGFSYSWMKGQWPNTYPGCARLF